MIDTVAIEIDGIDKSGKDTIEHYFSLLTNYKYVLNIRGILSQLVYNDKFHRNEEYTLYYKPLIFLLTVDENDFLVRSKLTNEPMIHYKKDSYSFMTYAEYLKSLEIPVFTLNTTRYTPYMIATKMKKILSSINSNTFLCKEPIKLQNLNIYSLEDLKGEDIFYNGVES